MSLSRQRMMMKSFSSESELLSRIRRWTKSPVSPYGIGDDAARLPSGKGKDQVITTDFLVEDVDFKKGDDLARVGRKVLAVNLSDLAAMGAEPQSALLYLSFPGSPSPSKFQRFFKGWQSLARKYKVSLIGGDLSRAKHWMAGAVLVGTCPPNAGFLRTGARTGDSIWVTGTLGGSIRGKHFRFEPRIKEALFLREHFPVTACLDLSDGLGRDLPRLLEASRKGARIFLDKVPVSRAAEKLAQRSRRSALEHAFQDGEDFELLFSLGAKHDAGLIKRWRQKFRIPLTKIGTVALEGKIRCFTGPREERSGSRLWKGFDHFQ